MSGATERLMVDFMSRLTSVPGVTTVERSEFETSSVDDLPLLQVSQGNEEMELLTLTSSGGTYRCELTVFIDIVCGKGTQNIETTLNNLRRNVLTAIHAETSFYQVFEQSATQPEMQEESGDKVGRTTLSFSCVYERPYNDAT